MINANGIDGTIQETGELTATVQSTSGLNGSVKTIGEVDGTITSTGEIDGSVTSNNAIEGDLNNTGVNAVMSEADPIFKSSPAYKITASDINNWNNKEEKKNKVTQININSTDEQYPSARATRIFTQDAVNDLANTIMPVFSGLADEIGKKQDTLEAGDNVEIVDNKISVLTTSEAEEDNTKPMTSAGVYTQLGNITILLETI